MPTRRSTRNLCALAVALLGLYACAKDPSPPPVPPAIPTESDVEAQIPELDERIADLQRSIEIDHQRLVVLITTPVEEESPLHQNPELVAIANRLPGMQQELRALQMERSRLEPKP